MLGHVALRPAEVGVLKDEAPHVVKAGDLHFVTV
jgi:hypothetical protein